MRSNITEPVTVRLYVASSGKSSEPQEFKYTPVAGVVPSGKIFYIFSLSSLFRASFAQTK